MSLFDDLVHAGRDIVKKEDRAVEEKDFFDELCEEAVKESKTEDEKKRVAAILKKDTPFNKDVKKQLQRARKPKMRTVQHYLCDHCDCMIPDPEQGFIIHGNVYTADATCQGGLVGNNFPDEDTFTIDKVEKTVLCRQCLLEALGILGNTKRGKEEPHTPLLLDPVDHNDDPWGARRVQRR